MSSCAVWLWSYSISQRRYWLLQGDVRCSGQKVELVTSSFAAQCCNFSDANCSKNGWENKCKNLWFRLGLHAPLLLNTFSWNGQCRRVSLELLTMILFLYCTVRATAWYCCPKSKNNDSVPSPVTYRDSCWLSTWLRRWRSCGTRVSSWGDGVSVAVDWWL